jgi:N-methylhydantoinase B
LKFPPQGLFGGGPGKTAYYGLVDPAGNASPRRSKMTFSVPRGWFVTMQTCGGGGYGPASERDPELVLRDVLEGKVSIERAREAYKVAIDESSKRIDKEQTRRLRHGT